MNLPNFLTCCRVCLVPPLCLLLWGGLNLYALAVFAVAAVTDFFDGYLARKTSPTAFGRLLDPIADKLLVISTLVVLIGLGDSSLVLPTLLLIAREVAVGGKRIWVARQQLTMPPLTLAKWKTALQMLALALLIVGAPSASPLAVLGLWLLWAAVALSLISGWQYLR